MADRAAAEVAPHPRNSSAVRRALHAFPETGFAEIRTADLLWRTLHDLGWALSGGDLVDVAGYAGLPPEPELAAAAAAARTQGVGAAAVDRFAGGRTAFVAELAGARPGPTVALRVDMDALPVQESTAPGHRPAANGFASRNPGRMHACGHDGHMAIALRLAAGLAADRDFPGTVRLLLQPAEEGVRGAAPMVEAGLCADVDVLLAVHLGFGMPLGQVGPATDLFATTKLRAEFTGVAAHASGAPEQGRSALLAAAGATLALHGLPRHSGTPTRVNVGTLHAGGGANIVSAHAVLEAEVRAGTAEALDGLERRALAVLDGAAAMQGVTVTTARTGRATSAESDAALVAALGEHADRRGLRFRREPHALRASDDASLMMRAVQAAGGLAAYLLVGSGDFGPHHSPTFDMEEAALPPAADLLEAAIRRGLPVTHGVVS